MVMINDARMQENECMRQEMEHLLHYYGADIVLQGHVHSCALLTATHHIIPHIQALL